MKKWLIVFCLMIFPAFAQEISNDTFNENNPNIIHNNENRPRTTSSLLDLIINYLTFQNYEDNINIQNNFHHHHLFLYFLHYH